MGHNGGVVFDEVFRHSVKNHVVASQKEEPGLGHCWSRFRTELGAVDQFNRLHAFRAVSSLPIVTDARDKKINSFARHTFEYFAGGVGHDLGHTLVGVTWLTLYVSKTITVYQCVERFVLLLDPEECPHVSATAADDRS